MVFSRICAGFILVFFLSCDNATDPVSGEKKLYITITDPSGNPLQDAGLHFYLNRGLPKLELHKMSAQNGGTITGPQAEYELYQNFPNPFNPATTIHFFLPEPASITLEVLHRKDSTVVNTLMEGPLLAGHYNVLWSGTNAGGRNLTNNVYRYRLTAPGFEDTKRMFINMADPEHIRSLDCLPLAHSDARGKIEVDYDIFPLGETVIVTDHMGEETGSFQVPGSLILVLLKDGYQPATAAVNLNRQAPLELTVKLVPVTGG